MPHQIFSASELWSLSSLLRKRRICFEVHFGLWIPILQNIGECRTGLKDTYIMSGNLPLSGTDFFSQMTGEEVNKTP